MIPVLHIHGRQPARRPSLERMRVLYPWEIPEVQELTEPIQELSEERDNVEPNEDVDEPGWGALLCEKLRDLKIVA